MKFTVHTMKTSGSNGEVMYCFIDSHGNTIAQAIGEGPCKSLRKYLKDGLE